VPLGAVLDRADVPLRRLLFALHLVPLFLPPLFTALGAFHLLGAGGLLGGARSSSVLFSPAGTALCEVIALSPIVTAMTALGIGGLDASLEEAGRVAAPPCRV